MMVDRGSTIPDHFRARSAQRLRGPHTPKMHRMMPCIRRNITLRCVPCGKFLGAK